MAKVNLDALIPRADFGIQSKTDDSTDFYNMISLSEFSKGSLRGPNYRKPDFQRETNHWSPKQVVSLLESFISGDLVPSVILWKSPTYLFVIDGGHRLSVLKAWVENDYGDGAISYEYFGRNISPQQKRLAARTRRLVDNSIGSYQQLLLKNDKPDLSPEERQKITNIISRGLPVQWVKGDAGKAEQSFFKINTQGTPLDKTEELLLRNRNKPIPIAARAIIRAGTGHKYWSKFNEEVSNNIVELSKSLHDTLFQPDIKRPIKTLDLPLGGSTGVRTALQILIDFLLFANQDQTGKPDGVESFEDDVSGHGTEQALKRALRLAKRISGNDSGSLGLHPAVYFYGPSGRHSRSMFLGVSKLISRKIINNDSQFFFTFTEYREQLETILTTKKDLVATIIQKNISHKRNDMFANLIDSILNRFKAGESVSDLDIVSITGLDGKIVLGEVSNENKNFSESVKSKAFITKAIETTMKCPLCKGYLDPEKSISYDHIIRKRDQGGGSLENLQLTHPFCNQSYKN